MKYLEPQHRILRYLAKIEDNLDNEVYMSNPHLVKCFTNGELDMVKVRQHFIDRQILTGDEFDEAVDKLKLAGFIGDKFRAEQKAVLFNRKIEKERKKEMKKLSLDKNTFTEEDKIKTERLNNKDYKE